LNSRLNPGQKNGAFREEGTNPVGRSTRYSIITTIPSQSFTTAALLKNHP
jgi:hypothetical protein